MELQFILEETLNKVFYGVPIMGYGEKSVAISDARALELWLQDVAFSDNAIERMRKLYSADELGRKFVAHTDHRTGEIMLVIWTVPVENTVYRKTLTEQEAALEFNKGTEFTKAAEARIKQVITRGYACRRIEYYLQLPYAHSGEPLCIEINRADAMRLYEAGTHRVEIDGAKATVLPVVPADINPLSEG